LSIDIVDRAQQMQVRTDPGAVDQILFNLVDNACKYAAGGAESRISIAVQPAGRRVRIRVQDRGPGISAAGLRRLFRPFSKSAEEAAESAPGVGLGLALCQRLAKQMGAALRYDAKGQGACFVLSLPAA
jgi:signal transduction histidine kinase